MGGFGSGAFVYLGGVASERRASGELDPGSGAFVFLMGVASERSGEW
jgi:hypothetical protein